MLAIESSMCCLLHIYGYCFEVGTILLENKVSIGTGFPTRSYKEKYVINNWQCPEGAVKHPKKGQGTEKEVEMPEESHSETFYEEKANAV